MKNLIKWSAIAVVTAFGVVLAIGLLTPDKQASSQQAQLGGTAPPSSAAPSAIPTANAPKVSYAADQCLDGICIGMLAGEQTSSAWGKKTGIPDNQLDSKLREVNEVQQQSFSEKCQSRQTSWGSKAAEMCDLLSRGASNGGIDQVRPHQTSKILNFFASQSIPVCEFDQDEKVRILGFIDTETGRTLVKFRFDTNGLLRVYEISKQYRDQNLDTSTAIASKLVEKHPYAVNPALDVFGKPKRLGRNERDVAGEAPWGGTVSIEQRDGEGVLIVMTAKATDFDQSNLAACKQAKTVSVQ